MLAHDLSNWDAVLTQSRLAEFVNNGVGLIITQSISPPAGYPPSVTRQHLEACALFGMPTDAYLWVWTHSAVEADIEAKLRLLAGLEHRVGKLWIDAEDTAGATVEARLDALRRAFDVVDHWSLTHGKPRAGLYSGGWWWRGYVSNTNEFGDRDLWDSDYDHVPDIDHGWSPYGGWQNREIKQFVGSPLDTNVLSAAEEARVLGTNPEPEPPPECDWGWQGKKHDVVSVAGELLTVSDQMLAEANRPAGPRRTVLRKLANPEVRARAERILS